MAGQRLRGQRGQHGGHGEGPGLRDQLPIQDVGEGAFDAVVDGAPAEGRWRKNTYFRLIMYEECGFTTKRLITLVLLHDLSAPVMSTLSIINLQHVFYFIFLDPENLFTRPDSIICERIGNQRANIFGGNRKMTRWWWRSESRNPICKNKKTKKKKTRRL